MFPKNRVSTHDMGEVESPFLNQELCVERGEAAWELGAAALAAESPFHSAFEQGRDQLDSADMEEAWASPALTRWYPEAEHDEPHGTAWAPESSTEEGEDFTTADYGEEELELLVEQPLEERFDPSAVPQDVADALGKKDWPLALKLAIQAGWRDESALTNLIFFTCHPELPNEPLDKKDPKFNQLSNEWTKILNEVVWKAIQVSAENTDLVVSGEEVTDHHRRFFRGQTGKRLKQLVEDAAVEVGLNPGLLGTIMMAETRRPHSYLSSEKVSSYHIGADDFYEGRTAIQARVPAYAKVKWDKKQTPIVQDNDAKKPRKVKTILVDSGPDAVLATAVYVKFREVRLREIATALQGDFDKLPLATRFALTRMAMAAGTAGATPFLKEALQGVDIFVRKAIPVRAYQTRRNATVRTAQAMHLSDWIFGNRLAPATQPEIEKSEGWDEEQAGRYDVEPEFTGESGEAWENLEFDDAWAEGKQDNAHDELVNRDIQVFPVGPVQQELASEEYEFRLDRLPAQARQYFRMGGASWRAAVAEAIRAGIRKPNVLANLIFFMQHPDRMKGDIGKAIDKTDAKFFKMRAEWNLYHTIATGLLGRAGATPACSVFLPAQRSRNYEDYVAQQTTGRVTLMINGRNSGGSGRDINQDEAFDSMQIAVESLGRNDFIYLAAWMFNPAAVPLTLPRSAGMQTWGDLLKSKANDGVKIRVIMTDFDPKATGFKSDLNAAIVAIDKLIDQLPAAKRDNFKYVVSMHPATFLGSFAGTHHQKFMVLRMGTTMAAFCGGLDISAPRTPASWAGVDFVWHDVHAKLEGRIVRDLEREFVLRWNREKDKSTAPKRPDWTGLEKLIQAPADRADAEVGKNPHKVQMLRTVSLGTSHSDIKRDDIWQGYFRLIGCATRFLFMENQYFREPTLADAIVKQAEVHDKLIVMIVVTLTTDDQADNVITAHGRALQNEFFTRLLNGPASTPTRLRVYTMFKRLVHSKLVMVDDKVLTMGSANANPRGFFLDTELNVMLDDADAVRNFRHRLWAHNLGTLPTNVATWAVSDFLAQWNAVAKANEALIKATPDRMVGEGVIPFEPRTIQGTNLSFVPDVLTET